MVRDSWSVSRLIAALKLELSLIFLHADTHSNKTQNPYSAVRDMESPDPTIDLQWGDYRGGRLPHHVD
jgi:hypothetical protein